MIVSNPPNSDRMPATASFLFVAALLRAPGPCTPADLLHHVEVIAADSMLGRAPGSAGDRATTSYLSHVLRGSLGRRGRVTLQEVPVGEKNALRSHNVIATIPGSIDEWVLVSAHHDALGVGAPDARGDSIYNGANDDAVGVALAVCIAQELVEDSHGRGVIVLLTASEEKGHRGGRYWVEHPTVPLRTVRFAVNLDAIGVTGPTEDFVAFGSALLIGADSVLRAAGTAAGFSLSTVPYEADMLGAFDSAEFGAAGIPSITLSFGTRQPAGRARPPAIGLPPMRQRYHAPSDEVASDWNPDAIRRYTDLAVSVVRTMRTFTGSVRLTPGAYQRKP